MKKLFGFGKKQNTNDLRLQTVSPQSTSPRSSNSVPTDEAIEDLLEKKDILGFSKINTSFKDIYSPTHQPLQMNGTTPLKTAIGSLIDIIHNSIPYYAEIINNSPKDKSKFLDNTENFNNTSAGKLFANLSVAVNNLHKLKSSLNEKNDSRDMKTIDQFIKYAEAYANVVFGVLVGSDNATIKNQYTIFSDSGFNDSPGLNKM